jgi:hypothetical protein
MSMASHVAANSPEEHALEFALGVSSNHQKPRSFIIGNIAEASSGITNCEHCSVVDTVGPQLDS